ncbi:MAG: ATP synthase F0 subunit B, partial [Acidimicrobiales bacterium]
MSEREGSDPDAGSPPADGVGSDAGPRPDGGSSGRGGPGANGHPSVAESLAELKADRIVAEARREARSIIDAARVDARREARGIVDAARTEAEGIITEAFEERARIVRRDWAIGDGTTSTDEPSAPEATQARHPSDEADDVAEVAAGTVDGDETPADGDDAQADESVAAQASGRGPADVDGEPEDRPPTTAPDRTAPVPVGTASRGGGSTSVLGDLIESPGFAEPFRRPLRRTDAPAARDSSPTTPPRVWPARLPRPGEPVPPPDAAPQGHPPPPPPPVRLPSRLSSRSAPTPPAVPTRPWHGDRRLPAPPPEPASPPSRLPSRVSGPEVPAPSPPEPPPAHPTS